MTEVPKVRMNENFDMQIKSIFYSSTYTGVVLKGKTGEQDKLFLYNNNKAKKVLEIDFTYEYNDIYTQSIIYSLLYPFLIYCKFISNPL